MDKRIVNDPTNLQYEHMIITLQSLRGYKYDAMIALIKKQSSLAEDNFLYSFILVEIKKLQSEIEELNERIEIFYNQIKEY